MSRSGTRPFLPLKLRPWQLSNSLTPTRTFGEVGLHRNGSALDIWLRIDGEYRWFAVQRDALAKALVDNPDFTVLRAESDHNAEDKER